jgi:hypothetical protein
MSTTTTSTRTTRTTVRRRAAAIAGTAAVLAAGALGASAGPAAAGGYSPVQSCTSFNGTLTNTPGITATPRATSMLLLGNLDGCTNMLQGLPEPGAGAIVANLSGTASTSAVSERGAFTINWPASSHFNPSNGTLSVTGPVQGVYTVSGTVTSGAFVGAVVRSSYVVTTPGSTQPVTQQSFVNTTPLQALRGGW